MVNLCTSKIDYEPNPKIVLRMKRQTWSPEFIYIICRHDLKGYTFLFHNFTWLHKYLLERSQRLELFSAVYRCHYNASLFKNLLQVCITEMVEVLMGNSNYIRLLLLWHYLERVSVNYQLSILNPKCVMLEISHI